MKQMKNHAMLLLAAFIWGCAFVAQSVGMEYVGPFTFNSVRCIIGSAVLLPVIFLMDEAKRRKGINGEELKKQRGDTKTLITGGICCGVALAVASSLQQYGILFTTVGKAGFITAMYIVMVPILGVFLGKRPRPLIISCVLLAVAGLYFLCMSGELRLGLGDLYVLLCAFVFSIHILVIDYFSPKTDGVRLSAIQFLTAGILCGVPMLVMERPDMGSILAAWMPVLYAGVMSCGVAYTFQILGQRDAEPTVASLLLSLESVFSVLAGWALLGQRLSARELFGCALMFAAIILAQLPGKKAGE